MSFLVEVVVDVIAKTAVWLAVVAAIAGGIAWVLVATARAARNEDQDLRRAITFGVIGAIVGASVAHRFGWPDPLDLSVWGRPLHVVWLAAGAAIGASASAIPVPGRPPSTAKG
ncbi:hypothetical protein HQ535_13585 [bacterium]|nr:hypothetical protein [bacterium]